MSTTITGNAAIEMAATKGLTLSKYADPTEGMRTGISVEEAREIAKEDPSLIFLPTYTITTECGSTEITTESVDKAAADFASREGWKNISDVEALADKWMRKGTTFAVNGDDGYHFQARA